MIGGRNAQQMLTDPIGWLRATISEFGLESFARRYYGVYEGRVIDNADPEGLGRVRATCPAIRLVKPEDVSSDYWMLPSQTGLGTDPETGHSTGVFWPPDEGTNVWVLFRHGDPKYPIYIGGWMTNKNVSDTHASEEALKKGLRTQTGHYIRMNDDPEDLHLIIGKGDGEGGPSPMFLSMDKAGSLTLTNETGSLLYMNAEKPETSLMTANSKGEVTSFLLLGDDKISMGTKSGGAFGISKKNITGVGDNFIANCGQQFVANAGSVKLGKNPVEPAVRGMKFMQWSLIHQHSIIAPIPSTPTGPGPTPPPMLYNELSEVVWIG